MSTARRRRSKRSSARCAPASANQYAPLPGVPALREAIFAHQRVLLRPGPRGPDRHLRRHRGDRRRGARAVRPGRRGGRARAALRLLRGDDHVRGCRSRRTVPLRPPDFRHHRGRSPRRRSPAAQAARGCCCSTPRTTRPAGCSTATNSRSSRGRAPSTTSCASPTRSTSTSCSTASTCRRRRCRGWLSGRSRSRASASRSRSPAGRSAGRRARRSSSPPRAWPSSSSPSAAERRSSMARRPRSTLPREVLDGLAAALREARDQLCEGLRAAGLHPIVPQGTYFVNADVGDRRGHVLPRAARARRSGGDPDGNVLRRQADRADARALCLLQATRGDRRGGAPARSAVADLTPQHRENGYTARCRPRPASGGPYQRKVPDGRSRGGADSRGRPPHLVRGREPSAHARRCARPSAPTRVRVPADRPHPSHGERPRGNPLATDDDAQGDHARPGLGRGLRRAHHRSPRSRRPVGPHRARLRRAAGHALAW